MNDENKIPVITIDGPSGTGKGTLMRMLAAHLHWHMLDSGAIYRVLALAVMRAGIDPDNHEQIVALAEQLPVDFLEEGLQVKTLLQGEDVTKAIRVVECSAMASKVSSIAAVRTALLERQQCFRRTPGLVTDGRDMGTVIFPDAPLKIYLDADCEERAKRRYRQLISNGINVSLAQVLGELKARDERDMKRHAAPLKPASDAKIIDTSHLSIHSVFERVLQLAAERFEIA